MMKTLRDYVETSSICVCTIPLLQLVGKQTQISCAQEPEHAPGFSPRVLDSNEVLDGPLVFLHGENVQRGKLIWYELPIGRIVKRESNVRVVDNLFGDVAWLPLSEYGNDRLDESRIAISDKLGVSE